MANYVYNIATSFHGISPNLNKLVLEIQASTISQELAGTTDDGIDVTLTFAASLSGGEVTTLDDIVDVHTPDVPFPYSKVTGSVTTNTTDNYQTVNTMDLYVFEDDKYKIDIEFQISSTLTGMDVIATIDGDVIYSNNQSLGGSLLSNKITFSIFEIQDMLVGLHKLEIKFRRAGALSASTIYNSKIYALNLNLS